MNVRVVNQDSGISPAGASQTGEELSVADAVVTGKQYDPTKVSHVLVSVKTNDVLVTHDGSDPVSSAAGLYLPKNQIPMVWTVHRWNASRFIRAASSTGAVRCEPMSA
jgi:hypothetical protein